MDDVHYTKYTDQILLIFDKENSNKRIYTKEEVEKFLPELNKRAPIFGVPLDKVDDFPNTIPLADVTHSAGNFSIIDNILLGDVALSDDFDIKEVVFRPRIIGTVNDDLTVSIDKILSIDMIRADTDSFRNILTERKRDAFINNFLKDRCIDKYVYGKNHEVIDLMVVFQKFIEEAKTKLSDIT